MELMEQDSFKKEQEKIISYIEEVLKNYLPKHRHIRKLYMMQWSTVLWRGERDFVR